MWWMCRPCCDFIAPAIVSRGDIQIAISTGRAAPALAKYLRKEAGVFHRYGLRGLRTDETKKMRLKFLHRQKKKTRR